MNQAIITELTLGLRRIDTFPAIAVAAIEQIIQTYAHYHRKGPWNSSILVGPVLEFVFRIPQNPLNVKRTKLKTVQRLEVAEILLSRLSSIEFDNDRLLLFGTFFPAACVNIPDGNVPHNVLSMMTSLSVVTKNKRMLKTIGDWMLDVGVDSPTVICIARDIATDLRTDENLAKYTHLPQTAFLFSSVLLMAIGKLFNKTPPNRIVSQLVFWIESFPSICFMAPHSSVFDMFRWVVNSDQDQSRLHLAVLTAISVATIGIKAQLQIIPHILTLITELRVKFEEMESTNVKNIELQKKCTERLLQLIQVLIGAECLDRNEMHPIFEALEHAKFPVTRLYEIMTSNYAKS